ncbi:hypothetical protein DLJ54_04050 [Corynebacterium heidelbergense]|uniref:Fic/DOC N-terminal domain-containing protein n=1 Tax=Corynebacterium heidelbergense TaxID=2055947 RepID=A0A364V6P5_9CORY|nr:hypothetical protein DLJ54_04050 [Corynebacterium heidelbergense]
MYLTTDVDRKNVKPEDYESTDFGEVCIEAGVKNPFHFYLPKPLPRELEYSSELVRELTRASSALGNLKGLSVLISDPRVLIGPYIKREALASSHIEGTQASLSDVFESEVSGDEVSDDIKEVQRYLDASKLALSVPCGSAHPVIRPRQHPLFLHYRSILEIC